ncbi:MULTISPECIES: hypothetical protein [Burkholderia]|uniref:hypothetical protein n=1 Tax=Burkholderia TaxID=32008 RepID=UPI00158A8433|nr:MULTISPECIES: hypothetical protein [Burkholderia]
MPNFSTFEPDYFLGQGQSYLCYGKSERFVIFRLLLYGVVQFANIRCINETMSEIRVASTGAIARRVEAENPQA